MRFEVGVSEICEEKSLKIFRIITSQNIEFGAVKIGVDRLDLVKSFPTSTPLQNRRRYSRERAVQNFLIPTTHPPAHKDRSGLVLRGRVPKHRRCAALAPGEPRLWGPVGG